MGRKQVLKLICCLFFFSCSIDFYHDLRGGFRPKNPNFSLAKKNFKFNKLIDTTAIYVGIDTSKYPSFRTVFYLKFYNNGRFFFSNKEVPSLLKEHNVKPGHIGYYDLQNNHIETEYYFVDPLNKYKTEYIRQKGFIKGDTIFLEKIFINGEKYIYVKEKLNFLPKPSNW